ncbi:MAG TPA: hypothetical protein PKZ07_04365 [Sedimentisphaerales bacterium]|nr:hypothetical protein [Sedimentisphaerales bacterium]
MLDRDRYRLKIQYHGLEGYSEIGFKKRTTLLKDLFPTADELILAMKAYYLKLDEAAAVIYEVSELTFEVVENNRVLELAVPNPKGDFVGLIIDILATDIQNAHMMMNDIETTCGFVRTKLGDALSIMEISEGEYLQRLKDSMGLLATQLHRKTGPET